MIDKCFDKVDMVLVLRLVALFLLVLTVIQAFVSAGRGAQADDMALIFLVTIANNLFQPFVLLGLAEGLKRLHSKV